MSIKDLSNISITNPKQITGLNKVIKCLFKGDVSHENWPFQCTAVHCSTWLDCSEVDWCCCCRARDGPAITSHVKFALQMSRDVFVVFTSPGFSSISKAEASFMFYWVTGMMLDVRSGILWLISAVAPASIFGMTSLSPRVLMLAALIWRWLESINFLTAGGLSSEGLSGTVL